MRSKSSLILREAIRRISSSGSGRDDGPDTMPQPKSVRVLLDRLRTLSWRAVQSEPRRGRAACAHTAAGLQR